MLVIPLRQILLLHLEQLMRNGTIRQLNNSLAHLIAAEPGKQVHPDPVVNTADEDDADADDAVSCVPEADVAARGASLRRVPRHDEQEDLDEQVEDDGRIPAPEFRTTDTDARALASDQVDTGGHEEKEEGIRVALEVDDCLLRVSSSRLFGY